MFNRILILLFVLPAACGKASSRGAVHSGSGAAAGSVSRQKDALSEFKVTSDKQKCFSLPKLAKALTEQKSYDLMRISTYGFDLGTGEGTVDRPFKSIGNPKVVAKYFFDKANGLGLEPELITINEIDSSVAARTLILEAETQDGCKTIQFKNQPAAPMTLLNDGFSVRVGGDLRIYQQLPNTVRVTIYKNVDVSACLPKPQNLNEQLTIDFNFGAKLERFEISPTFANVVVTAIPDVASNIQNAAHTKAGRTFMGAVISASDYQNLLFLESKLQIDEVTCN